MRDSPQKPIAICLMGPTAMGKTSLAMALADALNSQNSQDTHLISVDSTQVYRGMDIGSGKLSKELRASYPHALIDIRDPAAPYSAADFRRDALREIEIATDTGKNPILVGGTMLYFKALRDGLALMPEADAKVRQEIAQLAQESGWEAVHQRLSLVDPEAAARIHRNDPQRLQRALEVYLTSGKPLSEHHRAAKQTAQATRELPFRPLWFAILPHDRNLLHQRIAQRFQRMLQAGLVDEVRELHRRADLNATLPAVKSVGYRQIWQYLDGEIGYDTMVQKSIAATRQLAKRQLTWLRSWPDLHVLADTSVDDQSDSQAPSAAKSQKSVTFRNTSRNCVTCGNIAAILKYLEGNSI